MALISRDRVPSPTELRWFGLLLATFFSILGGLVAWRDGPLGVSLGLLGVSAAVAVGYYLVPTLRRPMYDAWMLLVYPIGWVVSHLILAVIYYLVITPIGLSMRIFGYDPMASKFERGAKTYWLPHRTGEQSARYFRQF